MHNGQQTRDVPNMIVDAVAWKALLGLLGAGVVVTTIVGLQSGKYVSVKDPKLEDKDKAALIRELGARTGYAPNGTKVIELPRWKVWWNTYDDAFKGLGLAEVQPPRKLEFETVTKSTPDGKVLLRAINPSQVSSVLSDVGVALPGVPGYEPQRLATFDVLVDGKVLATIAATGAPVDILLSGETFKAWDGVLQGSHGIASMVGGSLTSPAPTLSFSGLADDASFAVSRAQVGGAADYEIRGHSIAATAKPSAGPQQEPKDEAYTLCSMPPSNNVKPDAIITVRPVIVGEAWRTYGSFEKLMTEIRLQIGFLNLALRSSGLNFAIDDALPVKLVNDIDQNSFYEDIREAALDFAVGPIDMSRARARAADRRGYRRLLDLREGADLVIVVFDPSTAYGHPDGHPAEAIENWSSRIPADSDRFYSVVVASQSELGSQKNLAHELAHLLGSRHSMDGGGQSAPPDDHGLIFGLPGRTGSFGTLASVGADIRLARFSGLETPLCNGVRIAAKNVADEASTIRRNFPHLADLAETGIAPPAFSADNSVCRSLALQRELLTETKCDKCEGVIWPFSPNNSQLNEKLQTMVKDFAKAAGPNLRKAAREKFGTPAIVIAGYADTSGTNDSNLALSYRRANAVLAEFKKPFADSLGVPLRAPTDSVGVPIYTCAYGKDRSSGVPTDRDRRVELQIVSIN